MFGHRSFLVLGGGAADILTLIKGGYEVTDFEYSFNQSINRKGRVSGKVLGGTIDITIPQVPPLPLVQWGIKSREYLDGMIVTLDANNIPLEKLFFMQAACVHFEMNYTQTGTSYAETKIIIHANKLMVGDGIEFTNEWTDH
ncbi:type VI secretion system needle protein Hcp [Bacteroides sp. OttesenSCG-928-D19]|nr:type VI secretion system needle protein Hcp [Bacteroides sp. OttesenSCG-928-D19]